jgi:preprotein translocase subunit SecE
MAKTTPAKFVQEVRQEAAKVTWPTRREAGISTLTVFVMSAIAALFFFLVDQVLSFGIRQILGWGG